MAGSRNPADPRNQILVAVARAIVELKPSCALVENVSMVLAGQYKKRVEAFEETLVFGGCVQHILLNAVDFDVAPKNALSFSFSPQELNKKIYLSG